MSYARGVPVKKMRLKTFGDFADNLCRTFKHINSKSSRLDIVFDLYLPSSIKSSERKRRCGKKDPNEITISNSDTPLPTDMDQF